MSLIQSPTKFSSNTITKQQYAFNLAHSFLLQLGAAVAARVCQLRDKFNVIRMRKIIRLRWSLSLCA